MKFFVLVALFATAAHGFGDGGDIFDEVLEVLDVNSTISAANTCAITLGTHTGNPQPLFIRPGTSTWFHPATRNGIINMNLNQQMELFCGSGFASPAGVSGTNINVACQSGQTFRFNNVNHNFNAFRCREWPVSTPRRRAGTARCFNNGIFVDVGFVVGTRFLHVYTVCHNLVTEENHYAAYTFTPASDGQERNVERPSWWQADFYPGKNVDNLHTRFVQRRTIGEILNSPSQAARWIEEPDSDIFLARGHIAAMTDFITANEQRR